MNTFDRLLFYSISAALFLLLASPLLGQSLMTVNGKIPAADLGRSLSHEHVLVDFIGAKETGYHRWDRKEVIEIVLPHLMDAKRLGYRSLFECTPAFLGRDPRLLKELSAASGLHLVTNTGYYGARQNKFIPEEAFDATVDELAEKWIEEFRSGIEDTRIKPGFIKIAVDRGDQLSSFHEKLVRAACRTHLATGLTIASHTGPTNAAFAQASILQEEGVAPEAFIWVHATRASPENQIKAANMGLWISIDNQRENAALLKANAERLAKLKEAGLLSRVLVSQDAGWYSPGEPGGGGFVPYTLVENALLPLLREAGFEDADIEQLLVKNPAEAYGIRIRQP